MYFNDILIEHFLPVDDRRETLVCGLGRSSQGLGVGPESCQRLLQISALFEHRLRVNPE